MTQLKMTHIPEPAELIRLGIQNAINSKFIGNVSSLIRYGPPQTGVESVANQTDVKNPFPN